MKQYVAGFPPAAVARDQLQYAVAELSTHENQRVTKVFNDGLQAALTGAKTAESRRWRTPSARPSASCGTYRELAARCTRLAGPPVAPSTGGPAHRAAQPVPRSRAWRRTTQWVHALAAAAAGGGAARAVHALSRGRHLWHSFYSTPKGDRPAALRRPRQLRAPGRRPAVLAGARATTSGTRSARSRCRSRWRCRWRSGSTTASPGRGFLRLAYFTPTVLPMIAVANIWLFFYTPRLRPARPGHRRVRLRRHNWLGSKRPRSAPSWS